MVLNDDERVVMRNEIRVGVVHDNMNDSGCCVPVGTNTSSSSMMHDNIQIMIHRSISGKSVTSDTDSDHTTSTTTTTTTTTTTDTLLSLKLPDEKNDLPNDNKEDRTTTTTVPSPPEVRKMDSTRSTCSSTSSSSSDVRCHRKEEEQEDVCMNNFIEMKQQLVQQLNNDSTTTDTLFTNNKNSVATSIIRCAIVGCGMMGQEHCSYMMGYEKDGIEIHYLCDPHRPSIDKCLHLFKQQQQKQQQPMVVTSENELFEKYAQEIDLLVIATPNYLHCDTILKWGCYEHLTILCEKPVAVNFEQYNKLRNFYHSNHLRARVWVAMEYRYMPAISKLIQLVPTVLGDETYLHDTNNNNNSKSPSPNISMITIRENRYPFLHKVQQWNRNRYQTGDTLVEKCCHFFDLMRLVTGQEVQLDKIHAIVQRGINYQDECNDVDVPIIDSAYVTLPFHNNNNNNNNIRTTTATTTIGCLEICTFAEGSRHQEEIIVTGPLGRIEAYLPENKVYVYKRPNFKQWIDRSIPPPVESIEKMVYDCSDVKTIHGISEQDSIPLHGGYHYGSTTVEWYKLIHSIHHYRTTGVWNAEVTILDGLRAVEIGLRATQQSIS